MYAIVMAKGSTKDEVIKNLTEAIEDLRNERAGNALCGEFEYELRDGDMPYMANILCQTKSRS